MLSWLVRLLMVLVAAIAAWFVARDAANFSMVQAPVLLILTAILLLVAVFWAVCAVKATNDFKSLFMVGAAAQENAISMPLTS